MTKLFRTTALALAASSVALTAVPAEAKDNKRHRYEQSQRYDRYYNAYDDGYDGRYQRSYAEPIYADTRVWQGQNGQYYCRKKDGTTGLIIGGAVGALLGRAIDSRGDRTLGTIIGGAAGALLGQRVVQGSSSRCQ